MQSEVLVRERDRDPGEREERELEVHGEREPRDDGAPPSPPRRVEREEARGDRPTVQGATHSTHSRLAVNSVCFYSQTLFMRLRF